MIRGVDVVVNVPRPGVIDRFGNSVVAYSAETVSNVLVSPGATQDLEASRPEGVEVALTLHFPKSFTSSLEGCIVTLPYPWEGDYRVIGDPKPYIDADTPTPWHTTVEVEAAHG